MILSYSLGNDIPCEKLCKDLAKVVTKFAQQGNDLKSHMLVIDIKQVTDSDQSLLPKIEFKNSPVDIVTVTPTIL